MTKFRAFFDLQKTEQGGQILSFLCQISNEMFASRVYLYIKM